MCLKKIVLITPSLKTGGTERVVSVFANEFARNRNLRISIICQSDSTNSFYDLNPEIQVYSLKSTGLMFFRFIYKLFLLRKLLIDLSPDVVVSFGSKYNSFFLLSSLGLKFKKYVSDRSNPRRNTYFTFKKSKVERHDGVIHFLLRRILYSRVSGILCQTRLSQSIDAKVFGSNKVIYIPNPVSTNIPSGSKEKIILNVGRFVHTKGQYDLIKIYAQLPEEVKRDWQLVFLGGGEDYFIKCKAYAEKLKLKNVHFLGYTKDVDKWISKSEVFAFTSYSEGFPNVLAEAMIGGCACISYDCEAGPSDIIDSGVNGILVESRKSNDYLYNLKQILQNEVLRTSLKTNAVLVSTKFDSKKVAEKLIDEIL